MQYLRVNEVSEIFSVSNSTIWRWARIGNFPKPQKFAGRTTVWSQKSIEEFAESKN
jgi:predicted DNA-binding transcriptional regulator AlpA